MFGRLGTFEIVLIVVVVILLFGAKKLPEIGAAIGKAIREFRKAGQDIQDSVTKSEDEKTES